MIYILFYVFGAITGGVSSLLFFGHDLLQMSFRREHGDPDPVSFEIVLQTGVIVSAATIFWFLYIPLVIYLNHTNKKESDT